MTQSMNWIELTAAGFSVFEYVSATLALVV